MKRPSESVIINNIDAATTMEIVRDLRNMGLVQGKDFEFRYNPTKHEDRKSTRLNSSHT